jgi:hypothetical protein
MRHRSILATTSSGHSHGSLKAGRTPAGLFGSKEQEGYLL